MTFKRDDLLLKFNGNVPVAATEIRRFENNIGLQLPHDYVGFMQQSDGGEGFIGLAYVIFWRLGELLEMNNGYQIEKYAPGLLLFGSDGGGEAFAFDTRTSAKPIVTVPFIGMELSSALVMAPTFADFLEALFNS